MNKAYRRRVWKDGRCGVCLRDKKRCRGCGLSFCPLDMMRHKEDECRKTIISKIERR